jgi:hypothetical protein
MLSLRVGEDASLWQTDCSLVRADVGSRLGENLPTETIVHF